MELNFEGLETQKVVWAKYLSTSERSYWVLPENGMVNRLWS